MKTQWREGESEANQPVFGSWSLVQKRREICSSPFSNLTAGLLPVGLFSLLLSFFDWQIDKRELRQHQAFECQQSELRIVSCPKGCGQNIEARSLEKHVLHECPLELVPCDFQLSGCPKRLARR
jgi:hypothetical protein